VEIESGPRHCVGCGGERCFGGGVACEEFFLESVRTDRHPHPIIIVKTKVQWFSLKIKLDGFRAPTQIRYEAI
jgi:hypothetical protein